MLDNAINIASKYVNKSLLCKERLMLRKIIDFIEQISNYNKIKPAYKCEAYKPPSNFQLG